MYIDSNGVQSLAILGDWKTRGIEQKNSGSQVQRWTSASRKIHPNSGNFLLLTMVQEIFREQTRVINEDPLKHNGESDNNDDNNNNSSRAKTFN